jgi:putative transcriptional regulator
MAKATSRILSEMLETARDLHKSNLTDKRKLGEIEAVCLATVEPMPPVEIKRLRETLHVSQAVFATLLNTSVSTIQKWEVGDKRPCGPSLKLLNVVRRHGIEALS